MAQIQIGFRAVVGDEDFAVLERTDRAGSTLMYGSSLIMVTLRPRDSRMAASEAAAIPFPRDETTPPVTNTNLVITEELLSGA